MKLSGTLNENTWENCVFSRTNIDFNSKYLWRTAESVVDIVKLSSTLKEITWENSGLTNHIVSSKKKLTSSLFLLLSHHIFGQIVLRYLINPIWFTYQISPMDKKVMSVHTEWLLLQLNLELGTLTFYWFHAVPQFDKLVYPERWAF